MIEEIKSNLSSPKKKNHADTSQHIAITHYDSNNNNEEMILKN